MKLYELTNEYLTLMNSASIMPDRVPVAFVDQIMASNKDAFEVKALNVCKYIKNLEADVFAMREYEKSMSERRKIIENRINNMRQYLEYNMKLTGTDKVESAEISVFRRQSPARVTVIDHTLIPEPFVRFDAIPNKNMIADALKQGEEVPGCILENGEILVIK